MHPEFQSPAEPALSFELTQQTCHGIPVLQIKGKLTDEGWPVLAQVCGAMSGRIRVLDFTGVTHCGTTSEDAASFGRMVARQSSAAGVRPCLVLVAPGDLIFGLSRVVQMNLDMAGVTAAVFRSVPSAVHWLEEENLLIKPPQA